MRVQQSLFTVLVLLSISSKISAQNIAVNSTGSLPDTSAMLDVSSTVKGFLAPRMTTAQRNAIPLPATGLLIYNTSTSAFNVNTGTPNAPSWTVVGSSGSTTNTLTSSINTLTSTVNGVASTAPAVNTVSNSSNTNTLSTTVNGITGTGVSIINSNALSLSSTNLTSTVNGVASSALDLSPAISANTWSKSGNAGTTAGTNFIGTTDAVDFVLKTNNSERMRINSSGNLSLTGTASGAMTDSVLTINTSNGTVRYLSTGRFIIGGTDWSVTGNSSTNASNNFIGTTNAVDFVTRTNNVERMRVSSTGYVGIGTNAPTNALHVVASSNPLLLSGVQSGATTDSVLTINTTNGIVRYLNTNRFTSNSTWSLTGNANTTAGTNFIGTTNAIDFVTKTNNTERLRITSTGKIGIGTTSPNYFLHLHDATVSPSSGTWMQISNNASGSGSYDGFYYGVSASGAPEIWAENNLDIVTGSGTTNKYTMRLTSAGYVGIGTTSPGSALDVKGTIRLSGATSGYVGFAPAAAAGTTVYTLPSSDGTNGQALTTNGSGVLSWSTISSGGSGSTGGWNLSGNSGTGSSNYIGTSDNQPLTFKVNGAQAGYLGLTSSYTTTFGIGAQATYQSTALGASANANSGNQAVAIGYTATASGYRSIAIGSSAYANSSQNEAIAIGYNTEVDTYQGIAIGSGASTSSGNATLAVGVNAKATGYQATAIGNGATATAQNSTAIGNGASVSNANYISIGNTSVTAIRGQVNFTTYSDGRFKTNIKEDVHGLDFILKLRPVTYNWDIHKFNAYTRGGEYTITNVAYNPDEEEAIRKKESITYTGFIAQEVEQAAKNANFNFSGVLKPLNNKDAYSLSYAEFVVPLVKSVQELNEQNQQLSKRLDEQQQLIENLIKQVNELKNK